MVQESGTYAARLQIDYPDRLDRVTTLFRLLLIIPIGVVLAVLSAAPGANATTETGEVVRTTGIGTMGGLALATALMIIFRQRYPRWWFDFAREYTRFGARVAAYFALMTDTYPSTVDEQSVHLEIDYPDAAHLNRWLPLVKWFLAIPHYIVLIVLATIGVLGIMVSWFAILFTGRYPKGIFDFVVGVMRWGLRVQAYVFLLVTDEYPPFSMS